MSNRVISEGHARDAPIAILLTRDGSDPIKSRTVLMLNIVTAGIPRPSQKLTLPLGDSDPHQLHG